jgi:hypothetical protein
MTDWTAEKIAQLSTDQIKSLLNNAMKSDAKAIIEGCENELKKRKPQRSSQIPRKPVSRDGDDVIGFHFVCPAEKGITRNADGTIWTGTWVVDKKHAARAVEVRAYVALHASKSEPSYLQGIVKDWRRTGRQREYADGRPVQIEEGIDFLLEPTEQPHIWHGDGTGEKGYLWSSDQPS